MKKTKKLHLKIQDLSETEIRGGKPAGTPLQEPLTPKKPKGFPDILDVVYTISDEQWTALVGFVPTVMKKHQFASLCSEIVITVSKMAVKTYLPTATATLGLDAVLLTEEKLQKKMEHCSLDPRKSSPDDQLCKMIEDFVDAAQMAMQMAIGKVASSKASSSPSNWNAMCNSVADELFRYLERKMKHPATEDTTLREDQEKSDLDHTAVTEKIRTELKHSAGPSEVSRQILMVRPAPIDKSQNTSEDRAYLLDDLTLSCTNEVINEILNLCHSYIFLRNSELSTVSTKRLHAMMQDLANLVSTSGSLSKCSPKSRDLEESEGIPIPVSAAPGLGPVPHHTERLFSDSFRFKVTQAVHEALCEKIFGSVQSLKTSDTMTFLSLRPSVTYRPAFYINRIFLNNLERTYFSHVDGRTVTQPTLALRYMTSAHRIYRLVHLKVFQLLLRLQEDESYQFTATPVKYQESDSDKKQIQMSDEATQSHSDRLFSLTSDILQTRTEAAPVWRAFSDHLLETSRVGKNHPEQAPPVLASVFGKDSVRSLFLDLCMLSESQAPSHSADGSDSPDSPVRGVKDTRAGFEDANANREKPPSKLKRFNKALKAQWMKMLCLTPNSVAEMEDPPALLEMSKQAEINDDMSKTKRKTHGIFRVSAEKVDSYTARPLNDSPSGAEEGGGSCNTIGCETSGATPASKPGRLRALVSPDKESQSSSNSSKSETNQESLRKKTQKLKKTRQPLSIKFSGIRKVLTNPFKCVVHPD